MHSVALDQDVFFLGGKKITCLLFQSEGFMAVTNEELVLPAYELKHVSVLSRSF